MALVKEMLAYLPLRSEIATRPPATRYLPLRSRCLHPGQQQGRR